MKLSLKKGFSFGLTSGIITTLGLVTGLHSSTKSDIAIIGGILIIAISDSLSDALGMHISEESNADNTHRQAWESTISTFVSKFGFALSFVIPILILELTAAIIASIIWGLLLIGIISYFIARQKKINPLKTIAEHVSITIFVVAATHYIGKWISNL